MEFRTAMNGVARQVLMLGVGALAAGLCASAALAQASAPATPATPPAKRAPATTIQLSPAERQAIDAAQAPKDRPARPDDDLAPTAADMKPRAANDPGETRIEQKRTSNRVSEVVVTPANQSRSYVMTNRDGQQALGTVPLGSSGNLSVPMFFRFEFGRSTPAPSANPPPPPAQSPTR